MPTPRVAILSIHTSPLAQPGAGDGGGMNVYVRALASALARAGVACDVLTRADAPGLPRVVQLEPGVRVVHLGVGPPRPLPRGELAALADELARSVAEGCCVDPSRYDLLHANYWISCAVAHRLKHELDLPMVATFHTLARVKAEAGIDDDPAGRDRVEGEMVRCADLMCASTEGEQAQLAALYGADAQRIEVVPPGVDHRVFTPAAPAARAELRRGLGLDDGPVLCFVGRIQPLKGPELAVRVLAELEEHPDAHLLVVGGPSGPDGARYRREVAALAVGLGVSDRVRFVPPQPHRRLADLYRAADVCLVPSRSESFGLVALEAAACGTPVVAAAVGGLRSLVVDGETGFLVEGREPAEFARPVRALLADPGLARAVGGAAHEHSRRYAWSITAGRLRRLYADLAARAPVTCR